MAQQFERVFVPDSAITLILILLLIGFPIALVLAWIIQWSPEGVTRTEEDGSASPPAGQKLNVITAAALVAALGIIAYQNFVRGVDSVPTFATSDKSVAVLPFDDLSESRDQGWFADGVAEEILLSLARLPELRVISRTSSFHFRNQDLPLKEIADKLDVGHVVEGSIRRSGDRIRVTAQLIRAGDDSHLWSDSYDASAEDVFGVQEAIAEQIATALDVFLDETKRESMFAMGTRNVEAWELYSQASKLEHDWYMTYGRGDKLWQVAALTEKALTVEPDFLAARFLHVTAYVHFVMGDNSDGAPKGLTHADAQSVILEDFDAAARLSRSPGERTFFQMNRAFYSDNWSEIPVIVARLDLDAVQDVIQASVSGHGVDMLLSILGRKQDAFDYLEEALRRSPYDPSLWWHISGAAFALGGPDLAFDYIERGPDEFQLNYVRKSIYTLIGAGRAEEALARFEDYRGNADQNLAARALVMAHAGRHAEVRELLALISDGDFEHWTLAWALDAAGHQDRAETMYRSIDAKPGGPQALLLYATTLYGGKFFHDLDWTPNLAARLAEAGVEPERLIIPER